MQPIYYIASGFDWNAGDTLSNETFSDSPHKTFFLPDIPDVYANIPDYLARRQTESRLEELRASAHDGLPSRRIALFLNKYEEDARRWLQRGARREYRIYQLNPVRTEAAFESSYVWYNYTVRLHKNPLVENRKLFSEDIEVEIARCLEAYWTNRGTEEFQCPPEVEVLFVGELCVVRKVA
jgi:hypothetical protein